MTYRNSARLRLRVSVLFPKLSLYSLYDSKYFVLIIHVIALFSKWESNWAWIQKM